MPHPGFPTDMQPQIAAVLCLADGTSIINENVWDNRFRYVEELRRLGAQISVDGKIAVIEGVKELVGAPVKAMDLRQARRWWWLVWLPEALQKLKILNTLSAATKIS